MANNETTRDLKLEVLERCGELTNGQSTYEGRAVTYLNDANKFLYAGGNEFDTEVMEPWSWAKSKNPLILTLEPPYETGTVTATNDNRNATLSNAPSSDVTGWFLRIEGVSDLYRVVYHSGTSLTLDMPFLETTTTTTFKLMKLVYELQDNNIIINKYNDKLQFQQNGGSTLTATLTHGSYTPSDLATHVQTQLTSAGATTPSVTFVEGTRKFKSVHGGTTFKYVFATGDLYYRSAHKVMGFDTEDKSVSTTTPIDSDRAINSIQRLIAPVSCYKDSSDSGMKEAGKISAIDFGSFVDNYPLNQLSTGTPTRFAVMSELDNGVKEVIFNSIVSEKTRIEVHYIPEPENLKDNTSSIPALPIAYRNFLVFAACYYLSMDKGDSKAQDFYKLAAVKLKAMTSHQRSTPHFASRMIGKLIPRKEQLNYFKKILE